MQLRRPRVRTARDVSVEAVRSAQGSAPEDGWLEKIVKYVPTEIVGAYIAIAAVIFGGWTLKGTVAGCLLFGAVGSFALTIPGLGFDAIDPAFLAMAPSVVTIVAMAVFATRVRQPSALARPFLRGLK